MGFSRQEYWRGLPFYSPGDLPDPGIEPISCIPCMAGGFYTTVPPGKLWVINLVSDPFNNHLFMKNHFTCTICLPRLSMLCLILKRYRIRILPLPLTGAGVSVIWGNQHFWVLLSHLHNGIDCVYFKRAVRRLICNGTWKMPGSECGTQSFSMKVSYFSLTSTPDPLHS